MPLSLAGEGNVPRRDNFTIQREASYMDEAEALSAAPLFFPHQ